jgi:hypothetical protein
VVDAANAARFMLPDALASNNHIRVLTFDASHRHDAVGAARGALLLLLDPDLRPVNPGWLREMASQAIRAGVGAVGAKLLSPSGTVRHAGIALGGPDLVFYPFTGRPRSHPGYFGHLQLTRDVTAVSSACLMLRRETFVAVGGLDDAILPPSLRDVDLCLKLAQTGLRNLWTPHAELCFRHDSALPMTSSYSMQAQEGIAQMRQRWGRQLDRDPYWNPNLVPDPGELALNFPTHFTDIEALEAA